MRVATVVVVVVRIGVSGWVYPGWRRSFYPPGLVQRDELAYASSVLSSIEINSSFYALQRPSSYQRWYDETPPGFTFAVKGGRFITHLKRLRDVEAPLANFFASGVLALRDKLGPVLWQLPPTFAYDEDRLSEFFDLLPRTTTAAAELAHRHDERVADDTAYLSVDVDRPIRHAIEVRHASMATPAATVLYRTHDVALVVADAAAKWPHVEEPTSDFMYARLHGADELYASGYTSEALDRWADKVRAWSGEGRDVHVYFDNDAKTHAPFDAQALIARVEGARGVN